MKRPYSQRDTAMLLQLLYRFHCRAEDEKKPEIARKTAQLITEISHNFCSPRAIAKS